MDSFYAYFFLLLDMAIAALGVVSVLTKPRFGKWKTFFIMLAVEAGVIACCLLFLTAGTARDIVLVSSLPLVTLPLFRDQLLKKLGSVCLFLVLGIVVANLCTSLLLDAVYSQPVASSESQVGLDTGSLIYRLLFFCIQGLLTIAAISIWRRRTATLGENSVRFLVAYVVLQVLVTVLYCAYAMYIVRSFSPFIVFSIIALNGSSLVFILLFSSYFRKQAGKEAAAATLQERAEIQQNYYEELALQTESIQKSKQEIDKRIQTIQHMIENGQKEELMGYLQELTQASTAEKRVQYSDSMAINSILNAKSRFAEQEGIAFDCSTTVPSDVVDEYDLCSVLANLLDNAIEACGRVEGSRYIDLTCAERARVLFLIMRNSCTPDTTLQTRKDSKEHGVGLKIIESIVRQYNGSAEYRIEGETFISMVSFSMP